MSPSRVSPAAVSQISQQPREMNAAAAKVPPITMSKLYVGNLPSEACEKSLRQLFLEQNLPCTSILIKRGGYAFVDCPDQSCADRAIDKLNGFSFKGCPLVVEPSVASGRRKTLVEHAATPFGSVGWMRAGASGR